MVSAPWVKLSRPVRGAADISTGSFPSSAQSQRTGTIEKDTVSYDDDPVRVG